ncbi:MAG: ABC transporter permease, partial [Gammaproteobacteria bacterium]|nr:ABC transporter permease [Gammaproteobacteria bacterium]
SLGDIGFITTMILSAVFFTIVLLTGNTMAQSLRERIPEIAVLKTLGFSDLRVSWLMMGEALLLCTVGGTLGVGLAILLEPSLNQNLSGFLGRFEMTWQTIGTALGLALLVGVVIGFVPAVTAKRLTIADALRKG